MGKRSKGTFNILMYSHDTYGLGHIRRTMAIASQLSGPHINILILTGSPIAGRFSFPEQIDFVRIPGMIKKTNEEYQPLSIRIHPQHALDIRKNIITATAKTFAPQLFIVDKEPLGLKKEVLPTLQWMRSRLPGTHTVLGMRDVMDDASVVREDWKEKGVYDVLGELYSEIWVYGRQDFYNPVAEYGIPEPVSNKMFFTGYIPRNVPENSAGRRRRRELGVSDDEKLVVVTAGGGGDGYALMHTFLSMCESGKVPFKSALVTGPFMPKEDRKKTRERAKNVGARFFEFSRRMEELFSSADLVVSMGGYNTVCEILTQQKVSLIIPRETPRKEQLIRAKVLSEHKLVDYIPWNAFTPESLREKVIHLLENPGPHQEAIAAFRLTGIETMRERLDQFFSKGS